MARLPSGLGAPLTAALVLAASFALHVGGVLAPLEHIVTAARTRMLAHEIESDIVVVEIDSKSLAALGEWPWPRRHLAKILQHLARAEPASVFLDVDLNARTSADDDRLLESVLAAWQGAPVLLPVHFAPRQNRELPDTVMRPLPELAAHGRLVAVMLEPDVDGMVRRARSGWALGDETIPSPFDPNARLEPGTVMPIDYSILPSSFGAVSFADLWNGRIDPEALRGKRIFVGATAPELGDIVPAPVHRVLPGIIVQALAAATLDVGPPKVPSPGVYFILLALWTAASAALLGRGGWRRDAVIVAVGVALLGALGVHLYAVHRIDVAVVPPAIVLLSLFVAGALRSLDRQTLRAISYALRLRRRDALLRSIVESTSDSIVCVDGDGRIRTANAAAARLFGLPVAALAAENIERFVAGLSHALGDDGTRGSAAREYGVESADGRSVPVEASVSRIGIEDERLFTVILRDITERKAHEREIEYRATHDALTGLPNREALYRRLDAALDEAAPAPSALLLVDLGRFGEVNDALGHDVGDDLLAEAARRIESAVDEAGFVARIGADEFAVLLTPLAGREDAAEQAEGLLDALRRPFQVRGVAIDLGATIGIALAPEHARSGRELLRRADVAMYGAKRRGVPIEHYDRDHDRHTVQRLGMISALRAALAEDGLELHYQPQVDLRTGRAVGVEALLRWQHPTLGYVRPDEFIGLAESSHLIRPLTQWTLHRALGDIGAWKRRGIELRVAVNLSARVLQDVTLADQVERLLDVYAVEPHQLELEITESAMMLDPRRARSVVEGVHRLGVGVSIDDYGTGFSSLGYLRDLPIDALKLDKSFVLGLETHEQNRVIVDSTAHLAHALKLVIVAEGVETAWSRDYLARAGYDIGQGYYFSRPLQAEECFAWIAAHEAKARRLAG